MMTWNECQPRWMWSLFMILFGHVKHGTSDAEYPVSAESFELQNSRKGSSSANNDIIIIIMIMMTML
jgi:hypothetical protein